MNTIDPVAAKRQKVLRQAGQPGLLAAAIVGAVAHATFSVMLGLGLGAIVQPLRHSAIDSIFDERSHLPTYWTGIFLTVGFFAVIAGGGLTTWVISRYRGGDKHPVVLAPLATIGVAVGVFVNSRTWLEPLDIGISIDPVFQHDKDWGAGSWIMYYANSWLPALFALIAVIVVGWALKHNRRLRRHLADRTRLLTEGRRVEGTVTDVTIRASHNEQGGTTIVGADIVVKFTDLHGIERWVTRRSSNHTVQPGSGFAEVLFDPHRPEADDLIFVAFHRDPVPADWVGAIG